MADALTWTTQADADGRLMHVATSRHQDRSQYVVQGSIFLMATLLDFDRQDVKYLGGRLTSAVEAKQVCQRHEDALAERGLACGLKEATP